LHLARGMKARPVLLIDDEPAFCERVCRFLESNGIAVVTATNVAAAIARADHVPAIGAVVMDMAHRGSNDPVSSLRSVPALNQVPVAYVKKTAALDALVLLLGSNASRSQFSA
jgi:CheY-like chemotaxis protein